MKSFLLRLTSRKFLLAVAALLVCVAHGNAPAAVAVVLGYFGVNGYTTGSGNSNSGN
jgi:hypothetical protein